MCWCSRSEVEYIRANPITPFFALLILIYFINIQKKNCISRCIQDDMFWRFWMGFWRLQFLQRLIHSPLFLPCPCFSHRFTDPSCSVLFTHLVSGA
ncbi:hypothetical protein Droror1_Dr00019191 [Drosera rotundifolia]